MARPGRGLHRARPDHHPARRRHRLHRRRDSADAGTARSSTPRSSRRMTEVEHGRAARPRRRRCRRSGREAGVVTQRVADAAERAGFVFAVDPTSAEASCIGGNVAMNAGGKKAVLWGTALDNLASWRMVTPDARVARGHARSTTTSARSTTPQSAELRAAVLRTPTARRCCARERLEIPGATFRKEGLGKDVTDKFLAGPARHPEGRLRRPHHQRRAGSCTACRRTRARCASSSSATPRTRCPAIVEIKDFMFAEQKRSRRAARRPRAPRRPLPEGGRLRHQGEEARRPAEDGAVRRHRRRRRRRGGARHLRSRAHRQRARRRRLRRRQPPRRARSSGSTASAPRRSASTPTPSRSTRTW